MSEQDNKPISFGDPATEPVDLAQAFKMLNQNDREATEPQMAEETSAGGMEGGDGQGELGSSEPSVQTAAPDTSASSGTGSDDGASSGGSSDVIQAIDFDSRRQDILRGIQQQALRDVRAEFKRNGIEYCSIDKLWNKDENTGRVSFMNPDDPRQPFASRAEAQAWVDAFNKQIDTRFRQEVNKKQQELVGGTAPALRLISFAPVYSSLSQNERDILDDLVEPYGIKNKRGDIVGYNIDLNAAAAQAKKIAKRIQPNQPDQQQQQQKQTSGPAMDMPTGAGSSNDGKEPKTIGEALKMYDAQQRKKGKK